MCYGLWVMGYGTVRLVESFGLQMCMYMYTNWFVRSTVNFQKMYTYYVTLARINIRITCGSTIKVFS